jgi:two-component system cell cycle response regulator CpdR
LPIDCPRQYAAARQKGQHKLVRKYLFIGKYIFMARILVAEDDDAMRQFLAVALARAGHDIVAVEDGDIAARTIEQDHYDILLSDIRMPVVDGLALARAARDRLPRLPILLITSYAAEALSARDLIARDVRIFSKPFHLHDLVRQVTHLLSA